MKRTGKGIARGEKGSAKYSNARVHSKWCSECSSTRLSFSAIYFKLLYPCIVFYRYIFLLVLSLTYTYHFFLRIFTSNLRCLCDRLNITRFQLFSTTIDIIIFEIKVKLKIYFSNIRARDSHEYRMLLYKASPY